MKALQNVGFVKVRDHCHITGKFRSAAHRDYTINVSQNYSSHRVSQSKKFFNTSIMHKLEKRDFKMYLIPNRFEKYMSFSFDNKLLFIDSFESSSLDSLVKKVRGK